jgi:aminopeptidase YwaD
LDINEHFLIDQLQGVGMTIKNPFLDIDRKLVGDVYTSTEPMDNLEILCDEFGSRFAGTEGEKKAVEFFQSKMKEYGLSNIHQESFEYIGWIRGQTKFEITSPIRKVISCISLPHSPPADMEVEIIDMGDGAPDDFDKRVQEIDGRMVMTTSVVSPKGSGRWIHRMEKYGRSAMAGAAAFLFVNHYPGLGPATGGIGFNIKAPIPAISISYEDGAFIKRLAKRKGAVKIRLSSTDRFETMTSWNVVGDLPGKKRPEQIVMMGSHYDGHDIAQGAGDPASGAVSVLEAARVLAKYASGLDCTVRFVFWGAEEIGLIGSNEYARIHAGELDKFRFYLNMDSAGTKNNKRDIVLHECYDLDDLFQQWRDEMALEIAIGQKVHSFSDHYPLFLKGVHTGGIESATPELGGRGFGHTHFDTVDKVSLLGLREASTLAARLALRIAGMEKWPVSPRSEKEVMEILDTPDYRAELDYKERYDTFLKSRKS